MAKGKKRLLTANPVLFVVVADKRREASGMAIVKGASLLPRP
jgi:hypothetical protein